MRKDIADWRSMADEFSHLSSIVQTQNQVLKTHTSALQQLNASLEQKFTRLKDYGQRIQQLESGRLSAAAVGTEFPQLHGSPSQLALNDVKREVRHLSRLIESLNQRLQRLEDSARPAASGMVTRKKEDSSAPQAMAAIHAAGATWQPEHLIAARWPLVLLFAGALLLLLLREWFWHRRIKTLRLDQAQQQYEQQPDKAQDVTEPAITDDDRDSAAPQAQTSPPTLAETSRQLADEKMERAMTLARNFKLDPQSTQDALAEDSDDEALYAEIDILIAYQLYDEALNMVQSARTRQPDNHCLDIRELEILAYTRQQDLFRRKYAEQKAVLEKEFPQAWKKIETLRDEMDPFPRAVTF